jgi:hypothetical protein
MKHAIPAGALMSIAERPSTELTINELADLFGDMPAGRIRNVPAPGTATEADVIEIAEHEDRLCELIDGVLVEKTVGYDESCLKRLSQRRGSRKLPQLVPNLAIEVLSDGNTPKEMSRKLDDYFDAGVRLVWFVNPRKRTVEVFTGRQSSKTLHEDETLTGGKVLSGFTLKELFADVEPDPRPARKERTK